MLSAAQEHAGMGLGLLPGMAVAAAGCQSDTQLEPDATCAALTCCLCCCFLDLVIQPLLLFFHLFDLHAQLRELPASRVPIRLLS